MGNKATEGAGVGAATGGTLGGVAGAVAALGAGVAIPGIGLVLAGPLAGAGAGGAAGTLVGGLVGAGIPEERAKRYESDIKEGGIVLGVEPHGEEDRRHFQEVWKRHEGERVYAGGDGRSGAKKKASGKA